LNEKKAHGTVLKLGKVIRNSIRKLKIPKGKKGGAVVKGNVGYNIHVLTGREGKYR